MFFNNNLVLIASGKLRSASIAGDNLIVCYKSSGALHTDYYDIKTKVKKSEVNVSSADYYWVFKGGYLEKTNDNIIFGG